MLLANNKENCYIRIMIITPEIIVIIIIITSHWIRVIMLLSCLFRFFGLIYEIDNYSY